MNISKAKTGRLTLPLRLALQRKLWEVAPLVGALFGHNPVQVEQLRPRPLAQFFVNQPVLFATKAVQLGQVDYSLGFTLAFLQLFEDALDLPDLLSLVKQDFIGLSDFFWGSKLICHFNKI